MKKMRPLLRRAEERFFVVMMHLSMVLIGLTFLGIIASVIYKGLPSLSIDMVTKTPEGGYYLGRDGGILNAIIGSLYLGVGSTLLAVAAGVPIVLYINVYRKGDSFFSNIARLTFDILWGIPSIVYGAFGFIIMVFIGMRASLIAGIITVGLIVLPIIVRALDEVVRNIPKGLMDAAYSLGANRFEAAFRVAVRQVVPGIITAVLLAFGRAVGDAAAVLFTTGFTDNIPTSPADAAATLPLAVFFQLGSPIMEVRERAYAAALILTALVLIISVFSRVLSKKFSKYRV